MTNATKIFSTLSEARERLNAIIEHSFDGIFITDAKANVIRINHAYEVITGLKKEEDTTAKIWQTSFMTS